MAFKAGKWINAILTEYNIGTTTTTTTKDKNAIPFSQAAAVPHPQKTL